MRIGVISVWLTIGLVCAVIALPQPPNENSDEEKERLAAERFLVVLEKNPRRGTAFDRVYGYHVERGTLDELLKKYKERTGKDAKDGLAWMIIGLVEAQRGKDAAAAQAFRQAEAARPDDPLASYYLGQVLVLVGQPDKAAEALERAIAKKPVRTDMLDIFQALGRVYQRGQNVEQALSVWQRLEKLFPDDQRVREQIASVLVEEGQFAQALPRLEGLAKESSDPYRKVTFQMEAAELKVRLGQMDKALVDLEGILNNLEPDSWLFRDARRRIEEAFLRSDDQAGLAKYYEAWLGKHADDVDAMGRLAKTLATLGRTPEARKWLDSALKKAPSRKDLRLAMIEQLAFEQKFAEAGQQYEALDQTEPNNPDILREWGKLLLKDTSKPEAERKKQAAAVWKRLVDRRPHDALTATQVADLFRQAGLQDESLALYRKAVELAPDSGQYREYLGEYLHSLKKTDEALAVWRGMAEGKQRTAKNLARLAEVLASFAYQDEAIKTLGEASNMDKTDFALQLRYAEMLAQNEKFDDALKQIDVVAALAKSDEEKEAVLVGRIRCRQGQDKLIEVADLLTKSLANSTGQAEKWYELARYREALRDMPEAMKAAQQAAKLAPRELPFLTTLARLQETGGDMLAAAESYRQLGALDRKNKAEYLTNVAKLEARLGRREQALAAGKDLLAAAPGNPEHHKFYADLCFQLGNDDEGLEALRRAVRANPGEPNVLNNLAGALSERFRTGEAIELFWRAFAKANDVEARNGVVVRLTDLYLQTNQFDKLLERLERERREPGRQRDFTFCVAQAHQSAGDFGAARRELETLLAANPRDNAILQQLATLAEAENDDQAALKYLRQLTQAAPTKDMEEKLARALDRVGLGEEAQAIWAKLALAEQDQAKIIAAVDRLIQNEKPEVALEVLGRVRREGSAIWEALYREGVALVSLKRHAEAEARFRSLLTLKNNDDEYSMAENAAQAKFNKTAGTNQMMPRRGYIQPQARHYSYSQVQYATGLISREYYGGMNPRQWVPPDYGTARIAALAWMLTMARKNNREDAFVKSYRTAFEAAGKQAAPEGLAIWDWYHLAQFRGEEKDQLEAVEQLSKVNTPNAQWTTLQKYIENRQQQSNRRNQGAGKQTPPKPAELDRALTAYRQLNKTQPTWASTQLGQLMADLKLAKRDKEGDDMYAALKASASKPEDLRILIGIAASRADLPTVYKTADLLRKQSIRTNQSMSSTIGMALVAAIAKCAENKEIAKIPSLIDYQIQGWCAERKEKQQSGTRPRASLGNRGGMGLQIMVGKAANSQRGSYINLDYPEPNQLLDNGSIIVLRNAYEAYKEADLASDLVAYITQLKDKAPANDKAVYQMALSSLAWWAGDKPLALQHLTTVCQLDSGNVELQLDLAGMNVRLQNFEDALTILEAVNPLDQQSTIRKEELALSVSQRLGNLDRARLATQRLFGLRLDADAQARLAKTMQSYGMHDLAEAVLARARRQAGNKTNALTSLMQQFASQGKNEVSLQIAYQLLRKTPPPTRANYYIQGDEELRSARMQAVQVLSRSGKLAELINRTETQLKSAPNSVALWRTLIEYYQAAGSKEKTKEAIQKLSTLRPDDPQLRLQIATLYKDMGDYPHACDEYIAAFKKDPSLFANRYWEIEQTFTQANQSEKLIKFMEEIDMKSLGQPYVITNLMTNQLRNEKTREAGLRLFKKAWAAYKDQRQNLISNLYDEQIWKMPEIFDFVIEGLLPNKDTLLRDPWGNVGQVLTYYSDGRLITLLSRSLEMATQQGRLDEFAKRVDESLAAQPKWLGGQVIKAVLLARLGQAEDATRIIQTLLADKENELPPGVKRCLAQELEQIASAHALAIQLYESCKDEGIEGWGYSPQLDVSPRLAKLFIEDGRKADAKAMLLKSARLDDGNSPYDSEYRDFQRIQQMSQSAGQLAGMGFTIDAAKLYSEILAEPQKIENARRYYGGNFRTQIELGLTNTLTNLDDDGMNAALAELLTPNKDPKSIMSGGVKPNALDPILLTNLKELHKASISSVYSQILDKVGLDDAKTKNVRQRLAELKKEYPDDFSVAVLETLLEISRTKADQPASPQAVEAVEQLLKFTAAHPLEPLPEGTRPNARHRAEARKQFVVWLAAKAALERPNLRTQGTKLAELTMAIIKRMGGEEYELAVLKEWGDAEMKAGNKAAAEQRWNEMLKTVFSSAKQVSQAKPVGTGAATAVTAPATLVPAKRVSPPPPPNSFAQEKVPPSKQGVATAQARPATPSQSGRVPVVTTEQAAKGFDIARLAAEGGMFKLSIEAALKAVQAGPPVVLANTDPNQRSVRIMTSSGIIEQEQQQGMVDVLADLTSLCQLWGRKQVAPEEIYKVLREAVLPGSRPTEVFLYTQAVSPYFMSRQGHYSTHQGIENINSLGMLLAKYAVKAGQVDAVIKLLDERQKQPLAQSNCYVLRAQLAALSQRPEGNEALAWFKEKLAKETLQNTADLACHAAFPCLKVPALHDQALQVIEAATLSYLAKANTGSIEPALSLQLFLAKHYQEKGLDKEKLKKGIEEYLKIAEKGGRGQDPDSWTHQRRNFLSQAAQLYAEAGLSEQAFDLMGQYVDMTNQNTRYYYGDGTDPSPVVPKLMKYLNAKSPAERYEMLKTWTFPTATRKSIRWLASYTPLEDAPALFRPAEATPDGIISPTLLLIESAKQVGKLDELLAAADAAVKDKIELSEPLSLLIRVMKGDPAAEAAIQKYVETARKEKPREEENYYQRQQRGFWPDLLLIKELVKYPALHPAGQSLIEWTLDQARNVGYQHIGRVIHTRQLMTAQQAIGKSATTSHGLKWWRPVSNNLTPAAWAVRNGLVSHLGSSDGKLLFDTPMTGSFEVTGELYLQASPQLVGYGGIDWGLSSHGQQAVVQSYAQQDAKTIPGKFSQAEGFYPFKLEVRPDAVRYFCNGRLVSEEKDMSTTSPWLTIYLTQNGEGAFRNVSLSGQPTVPAEIKLVAKDRLDGWITSQFGGTMPPRISIGSRSQYWDQDAQGYITVKKETGIDAYDWSAQGEMLHGRKLDTVGTKSTPNWIGYLRPLRSGDSIECEFRYDPKQGYEVHPTLGNVAFLLDPKGVKLLWMDQKLSNGKDTDRAGIIDQQARCMETIPLKPGEWNKLTLRLEGDVATIELNGQQIYQRAHEAKAGTTFGFFHWKERSWAEARNIVLRGKWNASVTTGDLLEAESVPAEQQKLHAWLINEKFYEQSVGSLMLKAKALPARERFDLLRNWVLPQQGPVAVRLFATFANSNQQTAAQEETLGEWTCPAITMVQAAKEAQQLNALTEQSGKIQSNTDLDRRSLTALKMLVKIAAGQDASAEWTEVEQSVDKIGDRAISRERWPALVAARAALEQPALRLRAEKLLDAMREKVINQAKEKNDPSGLAAQTEWVKALCYVQGLAKLSMTAPKPAVIGEKTLSNWVPVSQVTAATRASGLPAATWVKQETGLMHYPGHGSDMLYLRTPLRGDFTVECEVTSTAVREVQLLYAGLRVTPHDDLKKYTLSRFDRIEREGSFVPQLEKLGEWYPFKLVVNKGMMTAYIKERKVYETRLAADDDPWLALYSKASNQGGVRNLKITGQPVIPEVIDLSKNLTLDSWLPDYYAEAFIKRNNQEQYQQEQNSELIGWEKRGDEIVGTAGKKTLGRHTESVLRYRRPLLEDCQLEYEFYYENGKSLTHPAVDRLVFLLDKEGVKVHWLSDAYPQRGNVNADNITVEPETRRGNSPLPLKENAWNRMTLTLRGDVVSLRLNDQEIAQRRLNQGNSRHFGLFHFSDETQVRVRNVKLRGDWPRLLPAVGYLLPGKP